MPTARVRPMKGQGGIVIYKKELWGGRLRNVVKKDISQ